VKRPVLAEAGRGAERSAKGLALSRERPGLLLKRYLHVCDIPWDDFKRWFTSLVTMDACEISTPRSVPSAPQSNEVMSPPWSLINNNGFIT
jgi:hypothetical protein